MGKLIKIICTLKLTKLKKKTKNVEKAVEILNVYNKGQLWMNSLKNGCNFGLDQFKIYQL